MRLEKEFNWASKYIGLPYVPKGRDMEGVDCWGLCYLIWRNEFDILVPKYNEVSYTNPDDSDKIARIVEEESEKFWKEIQISEATTADCLIIRLRGLPMHVAFVIKPRIMVHSLEEYGSYLADYSSIAWNRRVLKAYRHASR